MNAPLRRAHFRAFVALAVFVPLGLAAALFARGPRAVDPAALDLAGAGAGAATPADSVDVSARFAPLAVDAAFSPSTRRLTLALVAPLLEPDVLLYSSTSVAGADRRLPGDARLLGSVAPSGRRVFELRSEESAVVLYSLGHQTVIASAALDLPGPLDEGGER